MDLSKLQLLNTDVLQAMQIEIAKVLVDRLDTRIIRGRTARFTDTSSQFERLVVIERLNQKTVSVTELGNSREPGKKWKVPHSMLRVDPVVKVQRASPSTVRALTQPAPSYVGVGGW